MAATPTHGFRLGRDDDRYGEHHNLGIGILSFKVTPADSQGALIVVELIHHLKGGPPRHIHPNQDEWFHIIEGEYLIDIGGEQFRLTAGESAFGPRGVPHTWAFVGQQTGRITFVVTPAGRLEPFFHELSRLGATAPAEPSFWPPFDMALVGPPLPVE